MDFSAKPSLEDHFLIDQCLKFQKKGGEGALQNQYEKNLEKNEKFLST